MVEQRQEQQSHGRCREDVQGKLAVREEAEDRRGRQKRREQKQERRPSAMIGNRDGVSYRSIAEVSEWSELRRERTELAGQHWTEVVWEDAQGRPWSRARRRSWRWLSISRA